MTRQPSPRRRAAPLAAAALVFALPLAGMLVSSEMAWDAADFALLGAMLLGGCAAFELSSRISGSRPYRAAVGVAIVAALILVWINLAVGVIGSESNPANLLFGGVLAVGLLGGFLVRFRPAGMARTMAATALAQGLVGAAAVAAGWGSSDADWPGAVLALTGFFAALWLASAWLFRRAALADPA